MTPRSALAAFALALCLTAAPVYAMRPLYATDTPGNRLFAFDVGTPGAASWIFGFPMAFGQGPSSIVPGRDGTHIYATFSGTGTIGAYTIGGDGSLAPDGLTLATETAPAAAAISPDGKRLFVVNSGSNSVSRYAVAPDGSLSALGTATATGTQPSGLAVTPDGAHLYVANTADDTISVYGVGSDGTLTALGSAVASGDGPIGLAVNPAGTALYAANANAGTVSAWTINADGSLTSLGSAIAAGSGARSIAVSPDGTRALVANPGDSTISRFLVAADGVLTSAGTATTGPTGAAAVLISPSGEHAYVGGTSALGAYNLSPVGTMTAQTSSPINTDGAQTALAIATDQGPQVKLNTVAAPATAPSTFEAGASQDPDGAVVKWEWDFGDGSTATGHGVSHIYQQPGTYLVKLTITDDEGCSAISKYTGQSTSCAGSPYAVLTTSIDVGPAPVVTVPDQACAHDGNDGFCGTPDQKAPLATILGIRDGASINDVDAPTVIAGATTPDPSGIKAVKLRFSKAAGTVRGTKIVRRKRCRTRDVHGKKKRTCLRKKVTIRTNTKVPACATVSGSHNYLVTYQCSKVPWITIPSGYDQFRYDLPVALGVGTYTVQVIATDGAGNSDVIEQGRDSVLFKIVKTTANTGTGAGDTSGGTTTGTSPTPPVNDTGSPF